MPTIVSEALPPYPSHMDDPATQTAFTEIDIEEPTKQDAQNTEEEFEFVVGARHLVGVSFVAVVTIAIFSTLAYMTGKAVSGSSPASPSLELKLSQPSPPQPSVDDQFAAYSASLPGNLQNKAALSDSQQGSLFAEPQAGMTYIQMAAVEKSVAGVFVEGLRTHGLPSFAAQAPHSNIYRVLIGPLSDPRIYQRAKAEVDKMGLSTFARQYDK